MFRLAGWTEEEIARLKRLYLSEKSFEEILESFPNRTPNAVRMKASRLGLRRPTIPSVCKPSSVLYCADGDGGSRGYLLRCSDCGSWMRVNEGEGSTSIRCSECGAVCYLAT